MSFLDSRHEALSRWVATQLNLPIDKLTLTPLGGDAGFRRYFRFEQPSRWLAVDAPPATENTTLFVDIGHYLHTLGVTTPSIKAADATAGFLLVEDFGDQLLGSTLNATNETIFYKRCIDLIGHMQSGEKPAWLLAYDETLLTTEVNLFGDWFVRQLLGYHPSETEHAFIQQILQSVVRTAVEQPSRFVHRDFHCRNLLVASTATTHDTLAVIDFQGGLWGPITYDAVSLLKDCYRKLPDQQLQQLANTYFQALTLQYPELTQEVFWRWFDWMGLQRHIKVLGIFARLHLRDNKSHYLQDLPLVIRYVLETCRTYPELTPFAEWFEDRLLPIAEQHSWYSDYKTAGETQ